MYFLNFYSKISCFIQLLVLDLLLSLTTFASGRSRRYRTPDVPTTEKIVCELEFCKQVLIPINRLDERSFPILVLFNTLNEHFALCLTDNGQKHTWNIIVFPVVGYRVHVQIRLLSFTKNWSLLYKHKIM